MNSAFKNELQNMTTANLRTFAVWTMGLPQPDVKQMDRAELIDACLAVEENNRFA